MSDSEALKEYLRRYDELVRDRSMRPGRDILTTEFQIRTKREEMDLENIYQVKIKRESEKLVLDGQAIATAGAKEFNRKKNRYKDILPFDHSRVILKRNGGEESSDYINASYIMSPDGKKGYIASQGPMQSTVDDFWWMIWQHKVKIVVMACKEIELGKHRCQRYWPLNGEQLNFDRIKVTLVKEKVIEESLTERTLKAVVGNEQHEIFQLHYTAWPDHGVPKTTRNLIKIIEIMRQRHPYDDPPVLLHCSAGCGRTGVMVAVDYGRRLIPKGISSFDAFDIVMTLRKQRPAMVQSKEQYEYLHEVFKDLIEAHLKKKDIAKGNSRSNYVNLEFSAKEEEDIPLYENFDIMQKAFPTVPLKKENDVRNRQGQGFILQERIEETRKPVITRNIASPQKAVINTELRSQKPVPLPNKKLNLLDNDQCIDSKLQAPLLPIGIDPTPVTTVPLVKPGSSKDHAPQNYINVEIGSPQLPSKPPIAGSKPKIPAKETNVIGERRTDEKHDVNLNEINHSAARPITQASLQKFAEKPASPPKLPVKPKPHKDTASSENPRAAINFDAVDGSRPPLPLKHKDLSDFETLSFSDTKDRIQEKNKHGQEAMANEAIFGSSKVRSFEKGDSDGANVRHDLWSKYKPDYEVPPNIDNHRIADNDYEVVSSNLNSKRTDFSHTRKNEAPSIDIFNARLETSKPASKEAKTGVVGTNGISDWLGRDLGKSTSAHGIFTPFEPSSTVRVSSATRELVKERNVDKAKAARDTRVHPADITVEPQFLKNDGLVRRTTDSIVRKGERRDGLVDQTNYLVSIEKRIPADEPQPGRSPVSKPQQRPVISKAASAGSILSTGKQTPSDNNKKSRVSSESGLLSGNRPGTELRQQNGLDDVDSGSAYAIVQKKSPVSQDPPVYESIWAQPKSKPVVRQRLQMNTDAPPALPSRTPESFVLVGPTSISPSSKAHDDNEIQDSEVATPTEISSESPNEQASFPWLAAGVDKLKKITNIKGAFSAGLKPVSRQTSQPGSSNSAFYTPTPSGQSNRHMSSSPRQVDTDMAFGQRLPYRPKGPRAMPSKWTSR